MIFGACRRISDPLKTRENTCKTYKMLQERKKRTSRVPNLSKKEPKEHPALSWQSDGITNKTPRAFFLDEETFFGSWISREKIGNKRERILIKSSLILGKHRGIILIIYAFTIFHSDDDTIRAVESVSGEWIILAGLFWEKFVINTHFPSVIFLYQFPPPPLTSFTHVPLKWNCLM